MIPNVWAMGREQTIINVTTSNPIDLSTIAIAILGGLWLIVIGLEQIKKMRNKKK